MFVDSKDPIHVDFDKAIVAFQVAPQDVVVNNLIESSNDADMVVRVPRKGFRKTYRSFLDLSKAKTSVKNHTLKFDRSVFPR